MRGILLWVVAISCFSSAEKRYGFHPIDSLAGSVKTFRETKCKARKKRNGEIVIRRNRCATTKKEFDSIGRIISETVGDSTYYSIGWTKYTYDDKGRLVSKRRKIAGVGIRDEVRYQYDDKGNCVDESNIDAYGHLDDAKRMKFTCDAQNRVVETVEFDKDGEFRERCTNIRYDEQGNLVSKITIDDDGDSAKDSSAFFYDEKGLIVKDMKFDGKKLDRTHTYHYTADGKWASSKRFSGGMKTPEDCDSFVYNTDGRLVRYIDYNPDKTIQWKMYDFKYDEHGNWISAIRMDEDDIYMIMREFTYY